MKCILFICLFIPFLECKNSSEEVKNHHKPKGKSHFDRLLRKYVSISLDTLKVFSTDNLENESYPFKGKKLDSTCIKLFPKDFSAQYTSDLEYYACFKFKIDSNSIGLITRTPSDYESSSIKLLIFDERVDSIVNYMELAELIGDAGDVLDKSSWLFKTQNRTIQCFTWQQNSTDNSVDNPKDTTIALSNYYYLINLSKLDIDTISRDSASLTKRFHGFIGKINNTHIGK